LSRTPEDDPTFQRWVQPRRGISPEEDLESPDHTVIYRSRPNAKTNRDFEVFTPTDFVAAITQHIPDKGAQMVRHCGWLDRFRPSVAGSNRPLTSAALGSLPSGALFSGSAKAY
jgi:hypothetical protein